MDNKSFLDQIKTAQEQGMAKVNNQVNELLNRVRDIEGRRQDSPVAVKALVGDTPKKFNGCALLSPGHKAGDLAGGPEEFSLGRALRAVITGDHSAASAECKALGGSAVPGSFLLPSRVSGMFIDLARAASVIVPAGAQTIIFEDGQLTIPRITADVTAAWRAEGAAISESDPTFDAISVTPKSLGAMVRVSNELLADAPQHAGQMIQASLVGALGVALDAAALRGNAANTPKGIRYANVQTLAATATGVTWGDLSKARGLAMAANATPSAIILAPQVEAYLDLSKDSQNRWLPPTPGVVGIPRFVSSSVPTNLGAGTNESEVYVGDFSQIAIMLRQRIEIHAAAEASDAFSKNQTLVRAILRADVAVYRPASFVVLTAVKTA